MKKFLSTGYPDWAFNIAMLLLRVGLGLMILMRGYNKLVHFADKKNTFMNFLGMGSTLSLSLVVFAEFFCAMFVILGLFTRFTVLPLVIAMSVALFKAHKGDVFATGETAALFLTGFVAILLVGPGKASVDGIMGK
ncbi:MAG TPA: DoxX family protein [Agriterribacter sp.]|nr:DoxX family protein [Agriterribacter sp.]